MHVLDANELFWVTSYTFDRIMEVGWRIGPDAFALYFKLMKQARIQQTNQTYSLNEFLREWMWRWEDRLRNAKNILKQLGLVEDVKIQDEQWKIKWHYVRVNYLIDENKVRNSVNTYNLSITGFWPGMDETQCRETATSGWTEANALSTKIWNAWNTKEQKSMEKFQEFWSRYPNKQDKKKSKEKFLKLPPEKQQAAIDGIEKLSKSDQRQRWFIPYATTYINWERWEDEVKTAPLIPHYTPRVEAINRH